MPRPTKLTKEWIIAAKKIVDEDINAIILTDEELVFLINEQVIKKERISKRTFERWKADNKEDKEEELDKIGKEFCRLIKKALMKQKKDLFESLKNDDKQWQRFAWIIERKFDAWNIRQKSEVTHKIDKLTSFLGKIQKQGQPLVNENRDKQQVDDGGAVTGEVERPRLETKESILDQGQEG